MQDPLSNYLFDSRKGAEDISQAKLEQSLLYINSSLQAFGYPQIGDLFSSEIDEIQKTINCLYAILEQRQRDLLFRTQMQERMTKLKNEKEMYQQKLDLLDEDRLGAGSEVGKLQNKYNTEAQK